MVKFILVLQLCTSAMCYPPVTNPAFTFDNYRQCAIAGYIEAGKMFEGFDPIDVELNKTHIKILVSRREKTEYIVYYAVESAYND